MTISPHIAPHSRVKNKKDKIFYYGGQAKAALRKFGAEQVVDGTIGALLDDNSKLVLLPSVEETTRRLKTVEIAPYAPVAGLPGYRADVIEYLYESIDSRPAIGCVATAGATGALRLSIWDFLEPGDAVVTHDYFWAPYRSITDDTSRRLELFQTFLENGHFNVGAALEKTESCLANRDRVLLLINTPCHNPSGVTITRDEVTRLRDGLVALAEANPHKIIVFLVDGAYWEFGNPDDNRALLEQFRELPDNMLFCFAFTMSKSLTRYGFRTGALLFAAKEQKTIDDITAILTTSIRVHWSNTNRMGQVLFSTLFRDPELLAQLKQEQQEMARLCNSRGELFMKEADALGLPHTPYKGGFFVTLPTSRPEEIAARLIERKMFFVPLAKGVRVAFCAIPTHQISGLAGRIAACFES